MKNPVTVLGLPQPKEMSLECGQLRALWVRRGGEMGIAGREADLLNLTAGPGGCWGHQGEVPGGGAYCELAVQAAPLLGEDAWGSLRGDFAAVPFSDALPARGRLQYLQFIT